MKCVLVLASGAEWESAALAGLNSAPNLIVLKRCVDVSDLMAAATTGQADVSVVSMEAPGLDIAAVDHLKRHRVSVVGVHSRTVEDGSPGHKIGIERQLSAGNIDGLVELISGIGREVEDDPADFALDEVEYDAAHVNMGRVIVCWGAYGSPGRTTVAIGLAAELAKRQVRTILLDADPWGGSIAQHLGVLDEVSGVLAASRLGASGDLAGRFPSVQRGLSDHLSVITGIPRPDRWQEVRAGSIEHMCEIGRRTSHMVVDTGFSIEDDNPLDMGSRPTRNSMTLGALGCADEIVVVGSADPVGLTRLARGLIDLSDATADVPVRVVINRMRPSLGWSEREISDMVEGFARVTSIHFLPDDRASVDEALVAGTTWPDGPLSRSLATLTDALAPESVPMTRRRRLRKRTAGTARRP